MFPRNLVFSSCLSLLVVAAASVCGCTRNTVRTGVPQAPVAEPTANATSPGAAGQGNRNESEPAIPFDGSKPEVIAVTPRPPDDPLEKVASIHDIYAELTGQSLACEEARP